MHDTAPPFTWHPRAQPARHPTRGGVVLLALWLALGVGLPAPRAQRLTVQLKDATVLQAVFYLFRQTGYQFQLRVPEELTMVHRDLDLHDVTLARGVAEIEAAFGCEFQSKDSQGFLVVAARKRETPETVVGEFRARVLPPELNEGVRTVDVTLVFVPADADRTEAIAGLAEGTRATDSFHRPVSISGGHGIQTTVAARPRLTEYHQHLTLLPRDARAPRLRSLDGTLILFRKVTPLKVELPLGGETPPPATPAPGVEVRLTRFSSTADGYQAQTRLEWAEERTVIGAGISRTPTAYLIDSTGRTYRDPAISTRRTRVGGGRATREQTFKFEGVAGKPVKLVYDLLLKEDPTLKVPFHLTDIPLPADNLGAQKNPFYDAMGASLAFTVEDRDGRAMEGVVSLRLERKSVDGWSGPRWMEVVSAVDGKVRVEHLQPGTYRITRGFRQDPAHAALGETAAPAVVTFTSGKELLLPPLKLAIRAPEE